MSNLTHNQFKNCELKPCPFCGNPAYDHITYKIHSQKQRHTVKCTRCNASMEYRDKNSAVKAWNTRKQSSVVVK